MPVVPVRSVHAQLALLGLLAAFGCDLSTECLPWFRGYHCVTGDLGQECSTHDDTLAKVSVKAGSNDVVRDPGFENCDSFLCASTNGSRPYCTRRCNSDLDCNPLGVPLPCPPNVDCPSKHWDCRVLIEFGELACETPDEAGVCEIDENTGKVKEPAKYCHAEDGYIPRQDTGGSTPTPDGGQ